MAPNADSIAPEKRAWAAKFLGIPLREPGRDAPPPSAAEDAARFLARLKDLLPGLKQAQAGDGPASEELKLRLSEAQVFGRKKDFAQANKVLDRAEALMRQALRKGAAAPPPPPSPPLEEKEEETEEIGAEDKANLMEEALRKRLAEVKTEDARIRSRLEELAAVPAAGRTPEQRDERQALLVRLTMLYQDLQKQRKAAARAAGA